MNRNAIIMLVTPVNVGAPHDNSHAWRAINDWVDMEQLGQRLLVVFTKPDLASSKQHQTLQDSMTNQGGSFDFVLVYTQGADQLTSRTDLAEHFADLVKEENQHWQKPYYRSLKEKGQLGTSSLVQQLNNRLAAALSGGTLTEVMAEVASHVDELEEKLKRPEADDIKEARRMVEQVSSLFQKACRGAPLNFPIASGAASNSDHLHTQLRKWADVYANQQSYFIPGLLGQKCVRDEIPKLAAQDTTHGGPNELSKKITEQLHHKFFKPDAEKHALKFVNNTCDCIFTALELIIDNKLKGIRPLHDKVNELVKEELKKFKADLSDAACLLVAAFDADAQTLHVQPLFMTYANILKQAEESIRGDLVIKAAAGVANAATTTALAFTPLGPAAALLGLAAEVAVEKIADVVKKLVSNYKDGYNEAVKPPQYGNTEYFLAPVPWYDDQQVPRTAFEMVCKAMNCSPGFVVKVLEEYRAYFKMKALGTNLYTAEKLHQVLIDTMARMLCTYHAVTESVNKLVRFRLAASEMPESSSPSCTSLPYKLQECLTERLIVDQNALKGLLEDKELKRQRSRWESDKKKCEKALLKLTKVQAHARSFPPLPDMPKARPPVPADNPVAPSSPPPAAPAQDQSSSTPSPTQEVRPAAAARVPSFKAAAGAPSEEWTPAFEAWQSASEASEPES